MPEIDPIQELGRKLLRQGVPRRHAVRIVQELVEHRDDLEAEGLAAGQPPGAARSAASEKLGDIDELTKELMAARRRAYWWGRHPLISFVVLPLPLFVVLFLGLALLGAEATGVAAWSEDKNGLPEPNWATVRVGLYSVLCMAITITAASACYLARRCYCGLRWALTGCAVVFVHALFFHTGFVQLHGTGYGFLIGYRLGWPTPPELIAWAVPALAFALYYFYLRRTVNQNRMKTITAVVSLMCLALLATGCAANKVAQQRGWIGGGFLVAKRPSWRVPGGDPQVVPALPKQLESKQKEGIFVSEVYRNTPLALAGHSVGVMILAVNQQPVEKLATFRQIIDGCKPGSTIALNVFRDGEAQDRKVTVGRETYKNWHDFAIGLVISGTLIVDLIPNPDFSLIALGYSRNQQRGELHSPRNEFIRQLNGG